jgi:hypothetical protein
MGLGSRSHQLIGKRLGNRSGNAGATDCESVLRTSESIGVLRLSANWRKKTRCFLNTLGDAVRSMAQHVRTGVGRPAVCGSLKGRTLAASMKPKAPIPQREVGLWIGLWNEEAEKSKNSKRFNGLAFLLAGEGGIARLRVASAKPRPSHARARRRQEPPPASNRSPLGSGYRTGGFELNPPARTKSKGPAQGPL